MLSAEGLGQSAVVAKAPFWIVALAAGCGGSDARTFTALDAGTDDAPVECRSHRECDDGVACTEDFCEIGGTCGHQPTGLDCRVPRRCTTSAQCDDGVACTSDRCLVGGLCDSVVRPELCPVGQTCDLASGCSGSATTTDAGSVASDAPVVAPVDVPLVTVDAVAVDAVTVDAIPVDRSPAMDVPADARSGDYRLTPAVSYACQDEVFKTPVVSVSAMVVHLEVTAAGVTATWAGAPTTLTGPPLSGDAFSATGRVAHEDCPSVVRLTGTFSDARTFSGSLDLQFAGPGCVLTSCENQRYTVRGARSP